MTPRYICFVWVLVGVCHLSAQSPPPAQQVIEGGKVIVDLVKVFATKKDIDKDPGCKGRYADICIYNHAAVSMTVQLEHRLADEQREVIILPGGKECSLQARVGVWTYDLRESGTTLSIRKGDTRIEGCNTMEMTINKN